MAMQAGDIQFFLSNPVAGTGYTGTGTPGNSLGKYMATNTINQSTVLDDLFTDITSVENAADQIDYQCVFVMNNTGTGLTARSPYCWMPSPLYAPGGAQLSIGLDPTGKSLYNSSAQQAVVIADSFHAPAGVSFVPQPLTLFTSGVLLPALPPLYCVAIWIQRSALGTPPLTPQSLGLTVTFQSDA